MSNGFIKGMYDMAGISPTGQEMTATEERKLREAMSENNKLFSKNSETFAEEPKFHTCKMYSPCPICHKCGNKASHLYVRCQTCRIPICVHTYANKKLMIKRENFKLNTNGDIKQAIREMVKETENVR